MTKIKLVVAILLITALSVFALRYFSRLSKSPSTPSVPVSSSFVLPAGWQEVDPGKNLFKLTKLTDHPVKPAIVLIKSSLDDSQTSPSLYVDRLVDGVRSTVPGYKLISSQSQDIDGFYLRIIQSSYRNSGQTVLLRQNIYLKDNTVYTLTASYPTTDIDNEIGLIFDNIYKTKISNR